MTWYTPKTALDKTVSACLDNLLKGKHSLPEIVIDHAHDTLGHSVATAIADVFRKNAISVGRKFVKMLKIFDKIDGIKG